MINIDRSPLIPARGIKYHDQGIKHQLGVIAVDHAWNIMLYMTRLPK